MNFKATSIAPNLISCFMFGSLDDKIINSQANSPTAELSNLDSFKRFVTTDPTPCSKKTSAILSCSPHILITVYAADSTTAVQQF